MLRTRLCFWPLGPDVEQPGIHPPVDDAEADALAWIEEEGLVETTGSGWLDPEEARRCGYVPVDEDPMWVPEEIALTIGWTIRTEADG